MYFWNCFFFDVFSFFLFFFRLFLLSDFLLATTREMDVSSAYVDACSLFQSLLGSSPHECIGAVNKCTLDL